MLCWSYQKKKISPKLQINELSPLKSDDSLYIFFTLNDYIFAFL